MKKGPDMIYLDFGDGNMEVYEREGAKSLRPEELSSNPHEAAFWADMIHGVEVMSGIIARQADRSLQKPVLPYCNMYMNARGCLAFMQRAMDKLEQQWQQEMKALFDSQISEATASSLREDSAWRFKRPEEMQ